MVEIHLEGELLQRFRPRDALHRLVEPVPESDLLERRWPLGLDDRLIERVTELEEPDALQAEQGRTVLQGCCGINFPLRGKRSKRRYSSASGILPLPAPAGSIAGGRQKQVWGGDADHHGMDRCVAARHAEVKRCELELARRCKPSLPVGRLVDGRGEGFQASASTGGICRESVDQHVKVVSSAA